jgi:hypothetical protein
LVLFLEIVRLSGLRRIKKRDGRISLGGKELEALGLSNRATLSKAVKKLVSCGFIEVFGTDSPGKKLEYRLNPNWAKPKAVVVDLMAARKARKRAH